MNIDYTDIELIIEKKYDFLICDDIEDFYLAIPPNRIKQTITNINKSCPYSVWRLTKSPRESRIKWIYPQNQVKYFLDSPFITEIFQKYRYGKIHSSGVVVCSEKMFVDPLLRRKPKPAKYVNNHSKPNLGQELERRRLRVNKKFVKIDFSLGNFPQNGESKLLHYASGIQKYRYQLRKKRKLEFFGGQFMTIYIRKWIPGQTLDNLNEHANRSKIAKSFVRVLRNFEKQGIYHNDVRPWNFIWTGKAIKSIDHEFTSSVNSDSENLPATVVLIVNFLSILYPNNFKWNTDDVHQLLKFSTEFQVNESNFASDKFYSQLISGKVDYYPMYNVSEISAIELFIRHFKFRRDKNYD
jgi:hypothetical protein